MHLRAIGRDRVCLKFFSYTPGKSPAEHEGIEVQAESDSQSSEAAEQAEDKAERRHREEMIYRIRESRRQRDWQDAKDAEQRDHEKSMAGVQDKRDAKQFRRDVIRMVLSGIGVVVMFFLGQSVGACGKTTPASAVRGTRVLP